VSLLQAAMPLAATNFVLAQKYKIDEEVIANSIIYSTIISLFTIGGLLYLVENFH
jgi:predicted permease